MGVKGMLIFRKSVLLTACCLLALCCAGCKEAPENQDNGEEQGGLIDRDGVEDVSDDPDTGGDEVITDQEREGAMMPVSEDMQRLSNMHNQVRYVSGQIH